MPAARHRPLSALWITAIAVAAGYSALEGQRPGTPAATALSVAAFEPDESILPRPMLLATSVRPASAATSLLDSQQRKHLLTSNDAMAMHWNGHEASRWTLGDGRVYVVSPWGATWWLNAQGALQRTTLDLPGHDPALPAKLTETGELWLAQRDGGVRVIRFDGTEPQARSWAAASSDAAAARRWLFQ